MDTLYPYPSLNRLFFFIHNIIDICFLINVFFLHISLGGDHPKCVRLPQLPRPPPTAQTHARWVNIVFSIGSRCRCECDRLVTRPGWSLPPHALTAGRGSCPPRPDTEQKKLDVWKNRFQQKHLPVLAQLLHDIFHYSYFQKHLFFLSLCCSCGRQDRFAPQTTLMINHESHVVVSGMK